MRLPFSRPTLLPRWLLALLLLMYIGQSVASVSVPCHLLSQESEGHAEHGGVVVDHSTHGGAGLPAMSHANIHHDESLATTDAERDVEGSRASPLLQVTAHDATALHDCCDSMSHCGSGNCSMTSLDASVLYTPMNVSSAALSAAADESPARPASSLYRPPILS